MRPLRVLDLFSGIGGFSLGLERTGGFETVAFCEIDPFCRKVLAKHWPKVRQYEDVRSLTADTLSRDGISVDVICGGFPCQDISAAGKGAGIDGERSGLWREYARLIGEIRPAFAIIENVPVLRTRGADRVLSDLEAIDYTCEPAVVGAIHAGAPHRRQRAWLVAYSNRDGEHALPVDAEVASPSQFVADAALDGRLAWWPGDAPQEQGGRQHHRGAISAHVADANSEQARRAPVARPEHGHWLIEPDVGRVAHGVPSRVDRLRALGNAVVPQIPEMIGNAIMASVLPLPDSEEGGRT